MPFVVAISVAAAGFALEHFVPDLGDWMKRARDAGTLDWLLAADQPRAWLAASGLLLAVLAVARGTAGATSGKSGAPPRNASRWIGPLTLGLALASLVTIAVATKRHEIAGVGRVWSLDDDMMITLRYAKNLAAGQGLVWNPGERVEGITNLLWAVVLAVPHWWMAIDRVALAAIVLNGALLAIELFLVYRLVRALGGSSFAAALATFALATSQATLHWAAAGSESILLAVLLLIVANVVAEDRPGRRPLAVACLAGGLAWVTRPDAAPALVALLAPALGRRLRDPAARGDGLRALAILLALPLATVAFRLAYYGSPLPNTYYLKMTGWDGRSEAGVDYVRRLLTQHGLLLLVACGVVLAPRRGAALAVFAAVVLHFLYMVQAGGDELPKQRFFVPIAPLLIAAALVGAEQLAHRIGGARGPVTSCDAGCQPIWIPWAVVAISGLGGAMLPGLADPKGADRARAEYGNVALGLLIRANTQSEAKVAHFWAGATAYFSERPAIDFLGKCDAVIAHQQAKPGLMKPGHNKYDFGHSLGLEPDVVVSAIPGLATPEVIAARRAGAYRAFADLYDEPGFLERWVGAPPAALGRIDAMPQLVGGRGSQLPKEYLDVLRGWHAVFVRRDTNLAKPPAQWTAPTSETLR